MTVKLIGEDQLRAGLGAAARDMETMPTLHPRVAALVAQAASPPKRSGRLKASIRPQAVGNAAVVTAGNPAVKYAGVIEYGWPGHNIKAYRYLRDALEKTQPAYLDLYRQELQNICDGI